MNVMHPDQIMELNTKRQEFNRKCRELHKLWKEIVPESERTRPELFKPERRYQIEFIEKLLHQMAKDKEEKAKDKENVPLVGISHLIAAEETWFFRAIALELSTNLHREILQKSETSA